MEEKKSRNGAHNIAKQKALDVKAAAAELERRMAVFLSEQKVERSRTWLEPFAWLGDEIDLLTFLNVSEEDDWQHDDSVWEWLINVWIEKVAERNGYIATPGSTEQDAEKFLCLKLLTEKEKADLIDDFNRRYNKEEAEVLVDCYIATPEGKKHLRKLINKFNKKYNENQKKKAMNDDDWKKIDEFVEKHVNDDEVKRLRTAQRKPALLYLVFDTLLEFGFSISENSFYGGRHRPGNTLKAQAKTLPNYLRNEIKKKFEEDYDPYYIDIKK